jgi:hypothetical protein
MFCPYCRQELPEDAFFCNRCGKHVHFSQADLSGAPADMIYQVPTVSGTLDQISNSGLFAPTVAQVTQTSAVPVSQISLARSGLQRLLIRIFQPALAENAIFGVIAGSVVACIAGALGTWLLLTVAHAITPAAIHIFYATNGEDSVDYVLGIVPLHNAFRDSLQLFLVMHGVGLHTQFGEGANANPYTYFSPLNGLFIVPVLVLILGGYIAASTDMQNRVQSSLLRGGAIAIPYTLMLLIISSQVNGTIPPPAGTPVSGSSTLAMDTTTIIIFGLLWGILCGLLGASLKLAGGQWRHMIHRYLHTSSHPQVAGMVAGACSASALGLGLSFLTLCGFLAYTAFSVPWLVSNLCIFGDWQFLTLWGIAQGPLHAVNLFLFSLGAPITIHTPQTANLCFYSALPQTTLTLRDQQLHFPPWGYTLLFIPALSLFIGGRVSVAISRVQGSGPGAIQGILIAIPFTMIMLFLTFISTVTSTYVSADAAGASPTLHVQSAGVGAIDLLLWALLSGAIFGALGGIYEASAIKSGGKQFLSMFALLAELPGKPLYLLLDRLSRQPRGTRRSPTRSLLYGAFFCALLLAIVTIIVGWTLIAYNQTISLQQNQLLRDVVSVLLVTIPGLLLFSACATALGRNPVVEGQRNPPTV